MQPAVAEGVGRGVDDAHQPRARAQLERRDRRRAARCAGALTASASGGAASPPGGRSARARRDVARRSPRRAASSAKRASSSVEPLAAPAELPREDLADALRPAPPPRRDRPRPPRRRARAPPAAPGACGAAARRRCCAPARGGRPARPRRAGRAGRRRSAGPALRARPRARAPRGRRGRSGRRAPRRTRPGTPSTRGSSSTAIAWPSGISCVRQGASRASRSTRRSTVIFAIRRQVVSLPPVIVIIPEEVSYSSALREMSTDFFGSPVEISGRTPANAPVSSAGAERRAEEAVDRLEQVVDVLGARA